MFVLQYVRIPESIFDSFPYRLFQPLRSNSSSAAPLASVYEPPHRGQRTGLEEDILVSSYCGERTGYFVPTDPEPHPRWIRRLGWGREYKLLPDPTAGKGCYPLVAKYGSRLPLRGYSGRWHSISGQSFRYGPGGELLIYQKPVHTANHRRLVLLDWLCWLRFSLIQR
jgi:hypothetical protein